MERPDSYYLGTKCWECGHVRGEHDEAECRGGEDIICRCDSFVEPVELPDLEAPEPGTTCPDCGAVADGVKGFCAECHDPKPLTLEGFLSYAASSTVNCK